MKKHLPALLMLLCALLLSACGTDAPSQGGDNPQDDPKATVGLSCEALGFPCTLAEVEDEVLARSEALLAEAGRLIENGKTMNDALAWLREQEGVVAANGNADALAFRLEGGVPMWLLSPSATAAASSSSRVTAKMSSTGFTDVQRVTPTPPQKIVGHDDSGQYQERKRALNLAPFLFQFGTNDPSGDVAALLNNTRDYQYSGGVTVVANAQEPALATRDSAGSATLKDFLGWNEYDIVVVVTHGSEVSYDPDTFGCNSVRDWDNWFPDAYCSAGVSTGERVASCRIIREKYANYRGVRCAGISGVDGTYVLLDSDFFASQYGSLDAASRGLDDAIVFMGGCQTLKNGSLAYHLAGSSSAYFGWDESVRISEMGAPARQLFRYLLIDGLTAKAAYQKLASNGSTVTTTASLKRFESDAELRAREVITLYHPFTREELDTDHKVAVYGFPEDGLKDELPFLVVLDGVEADKKNEFIVTLQVNGDELPGRWTLENAEDVKKLGDYRYQLRAKAPLSFDIAQNQDINLRAVVTLPEGGESWHGRSEASQYEHELSITLRNPVIDFDSTLEASVGAITFSGRVQAEEVPLQLTKVTDDLVRFGEEGLPLGGDPLEYFGASGELRYLSLTLDGPCVVSATPNDGTLSVDSVTFLTESVSNDGFGTPDKFSLFPPSVLETVTSGPPPEECLTGTVDQALWFGFFFTAHADEISTETGAFKIERWSAGSGDEFARKTYKRVLDGVTEDTTIVIREPR